MSFNVNYANVFGIIPYQWNNKIKHLTLPTSKSQRRRWNFVFSLSVLHQIFVGVRLCQSLSGNHGTIDQYSTEIATNLGCGIILLIETMLMAYTNEFIQFFNGCMQFFKIIDCKKDEFKICALRDSRSLFFRRLYKKGRGYTVFAT